jgi:phosphate-selective porin OprO/OprP
MRIRVSLAIVMALLVSNVASASGGNGDQGAAPDPRVAALEKQIAELKGVLAAAVSRSAPIERPTVEERLDALDQQVRVLARQIELEREAVSEAAKQLPAVRAGREGFVLRSADSSFILRFRGYLQSDARVYVDDDGVAPDAFLMRRVRPIIEATVFKQFDLRVMPDFGGGTTVLQDAYLDARFHSLFRVRAGKYKSPFGLERLMSATDLPFIERALPTALVPNRDVGIAVHGESKTGTLSYIGGVFNGVADGASTDGDDHDGKFSIDFEQTTFRRGAASGDRPAERDLFSRLQFTF